MKRLILMIIPALFCGIVFTNCDSDRTELENGLEKEGFFFGTYNVTYLSSDPNASGTITIHLNDGKYTCIGFPHEQADISGNYVINNDKIIFEIDTWKTNYIDKNGNMIAYDFDTYIVPQGECNYTIDGIKLKLSKVHDNYGHYEWNLEKTQFGKP